MESPSIACCWGMDRGREHPCGNSESHIPSLTTMNGWVLFAFFFSCCKTDVAGTAVQMRNRQVMNSAKHCNHTSWMVSVVLDHSPSRTLIRHCCYHTLPPFLLISSPPSTSVIIPDQMHDGICVKNEESTWKSHSCSSMMKHTSPPLQKDLEIIFAFCSCWPTCLWC